MVQRIIIILVVSLFFSCEDDIGYVYDIPAWISAVRIDSTTDNAIYFLCTIISPDPCHEHDSFYIEHQDSAKIVHAISKRKNNNEDCAQVLGQYDEPCGVPVDSMGYTRFIFIGPDSNIDTTIYVDW